MVAKAVRLAQLATTESVETLRLRAGERRGLEQALHEAMHETKNTNEEGET